MNNWPSIINPAYSREEVLEKKREGRRLNQIDEEKAGVQRETSSGSNYKVNQYHSKQTSSYPTLLFNKPSIYEKVDTRCTSVWQIRWFLRILKIQAYCFPRIKGDISKGLSFSIDYWKGSFWRLECVFRYVGNADFSLIVSIETCKEV